MSRLSNLPDFELDRILQQMHASWPDSSARNHGRYYTVRVRCMTQTLFRCVLEFRCLGARCSAATMQTFAPHDMCTGAGPAALSLCFTSWSRTGCGFMTQQALAGTARRTGLTVPHVIGLDHRAFGRCGCRAAWFVHCPLHGTHGNLQTWGHTKLGARLCLSAEVPRCMHMDQRHVAGLCPGCTTHLHVTVGPDHANANTLARLACV